MGKKGRLAKIKELKVLSLFDGMSCGQIALDQLGIPVETYYASEIDKYAIQVTQANYPKTIHVGDVTKLNPKDFTDVDLIMGGSPCQGFSFAGRQLAFDDPSSALFFEFIRLLKEIKPKYFLLENVRMKKEFLDIISQEVSKCYPEIAFGIEPILINSALVSAQSRQRYYWTNIPNIQQPKDRGIVLRDILETEPENFTKMSDKFAKRQRGRKCLIDYTKEKASNLSAMEYVKNGRQGDYLACDYDGKPKKAYDIPRELLKDNERQRRVYDPSGKSPTILGRSDSPKITTPQQAGIAADIKGHDILKRVYSPEGKSPTLNTMGGGNREPKVAQEDLTWRKLTCRECERLQTVPDDYTNHVSNTQRYKMLGNGWTVEVIKHILGNINDNK